MSSDDDDGYDDIPDYYYQRLPVPDRSRIGRRLLASLNKRLQYRSSAMGQFREATSSESFRARSRAEEVRRHSRDYFENRHRMKYIRALRSGASKGVPEGGGVSLFAQTYADGTERRRLVVKYHMDEHRGANEAKWLQRFADIDHIVDLVKLDPEIQDTSSEATAETTPSSITAATAHPQWYNPNYTGEDQIGVTEMVVRNHIPMMVLEYMPYGDLSDVRQRCRDQGVDPPERFLWSLMLCLLRAIMGMEFYEHMVAGEKEEWPIGIEERDILHGNLNLSQVLVGPLIDDDEHDLMPMFKLCGFASTKDDKDDALAENIQEIGKCDAIDPDTGLLEDDNIDFENLTGEEINTLAHDDFIEHLGISTAFTWLIVQLLASDIEMVPALPTLLRYADQRLQQWRRVRKFRNQQNSHTSVRQFVQDVVLNAPVVEPEVELPEPGPWDVFKEKLPSLFDSTLEMLKKLVLDEPEATKGLGHP
ncbi:hypothetical protein LQW54_013250 [Pestalotiopsis sp. IQ-011]